MTILIVEDNIAMRRMIRSLVDGCGDEIRECSDGAEALSAYRSSPADCVLMDIKLPSIDGITAARAIREFDQHASIVIVTNYDDRDLRDAALAAGCSAYLLKSNLIPLCDLLAQMRAKQ